MEFCRYLYALVDCLIKMWWSISINAHREDNLITLRQAGLIAMGKFRVWAEACGVGSWGRGRRYPVILASFAYGRSLYHTPQTGAKHKIARDAGKQRVYPLFVIFPEGMYTLCGEMQDSRFSLRM